MDGLLIVVGFIALLLGVWAGRSWPRREIVTYPQGQDSPEAETPDELQQIAAKLAPVFDTAPRLEDLAQHPVFRQGVQLLQQRNGSTDTLIGYYRSDNLPLACLALAVLTDNPSQGSGVPDRILESINDYATWNRNFALRALEAHTSADEPLLGKVLVRLDDGWSWAPHLRVLEEFVRRRLQAGESLEFSAETSQLSAEAADEVIEVLRKLPDELGRPLLSRFETLRARHVDVDLLNSIGRVWQTEDATAGDSVIIEHDALLRSVAKAEHALLKKRRGSIALVGEHGVGKTVTVRALATRLEAQGWILFEAGQAELLAGQMYIGQLEERMRTLITALRGRQVVWFVPDFHALALAGRHRYGPLSILDIALPHIESGDIVVLGETSPTAFDRLVQSKPAVLTAMETHRIAPLPESKTRDLVTRWSQKRVSEEGGLPAETQNEAWLLAQQFFGDRAAPGNVLKLLEMTLQRLEAVGGSGGVRMTSSDLIATLTQLTGLPASILDDRQGLDLNALRQAFEAKVMGQPEATDCLVERVAMIKAGVADPGRPLGVFLFAGPTGTGKTEIAKTLASFLFGSEDRLLRLDMSEFQGPESLERILGGSDKEERGGALIDSIRKQPFSVILLDEFEKAHPQVWDVFLQLFDDGRLTDPTGNTADFRNAIVVLTSNLGSAIPTGTSLGFQDASGRFSEKAVLRVVEKSFRKEFINRLDRVIVFRPLSRKTMRGILRKELADAFARRGLRNRAWAVEWDDSAIEMLLKAGFTVDLGARPLRRAIERHLLAPLAMTIVNHQYPDGDQFLLVRSENDKLLVEFVDPDAPDPDLAETTAGAETSQPGLSLAGIGLDPKGQPAEVEFLRSILDGLAAEIEANPWSANKRDALARMQTPDFWNEPDRFATLGSVEYVDRIEAGIRSAASLMERLSRGEKPRNRYPRDLLGRIARQLFVLDEACRGVREDRPREAFIQVEAWSDTGRPSKYADAFAVRIATMYRTWAGSRKMPFEELVETGGDDRNVYQLTAAVSGYAAYALLATEAGLHVFEVPDEVGRGWRRAAVRVRVAPQPALPPARGQSPLDLARAVLEAQDAPSTIVRHYRDKPSPLVRDSVQGWRSGKLDRVLGGDFDLISRLLTAATDS